MNLNNKGQSLVMFVLIIPILLLIMVMVIDIGNLMYYKKDIDNINKLVLDYGLSNIDNENIIDEMKNLALLNNKKIKIDITKNDNEFIVNSNYYVEGIFTNIMNVKGYNAESSYKGYIKDNNKKYIEKIN